MPHRMYSTAQKARKVLPSKSTFQNIRARTMALSTVPIMIQGRNLPHLLRVLSTTMPIKGSLKASQIRATINRVPTKAGATKRTSVI